MSKEQIVDQLILERGQWYLWTMFPGYVGRPYTSPIRIDDVKPLKTGRSILRLEFYNAGYAEGVQSFGVEARVMKRVAEYLCLELDRDRLAVIMRVSSWPDVYTQFFGVAPPSSASPTDIQEAFVLARPIRGD